MTNFEKIKAMSVEEMAEFIHGLFGWEGSCGFCKTCDYDCIGGMKKWLLKDVDEDMLPEICSCGYRFETDETICPNCGKKVEEDG